MAKKWIAAFLCVVLALGTLQFGVLADENAGIIEAAVSSAKLYTRELYTVRGSGVYEDLEAYVNQLATADNTVNNDRESANGFGIGQGNVFSESGAISLEMVFTLAAEETIRNIIFIDDQWLNRYSYDLYVSDDGVNWSPNPVTTVTSSADPHPGNAVDITTSHVKIVVPRVNAGDATEIKMWCILLFNALTDKPDVSQVWLYAYCDVAKTETFRVFETDVTSSVNGALTMPENGTAVLDMGGNVTVDSVVLGGAAIQTGDVAVLTSADGVTWAAADASFDGDKITLDTQTAARYVKLEALAEIEITNGITVFRVDDGEPIGPNEPGDGTRPVVSLETPVKSALWLPTYVYNVTDYVNTQQGTTHHIKDDNNNGAARLGADIIVTLDGVQNVKTVGLNYIPSWRSIQIPVYASQNGTDWTRIGDIAHTADSDIETLVLDTAVSAAFIKFAVPEIEPGGQQLEMHKITVLNESGTACAASGAIARHYHMIDITDKHVNNKAGRTGVIGLSGPYSPDSNATDIVIEMNETYSISKINLNFAWFSAFFGGEVFVSETGADGSWTKTADVTRPGMDTQFDVALAANTNTRFIRIAFNSGMGGDFAELTVYTQKPDAEALAVTTAALHTSAQDEDIAYLTNVSGNAGQPYRLSDGDSPHAGVEYVVDMGGVTNIQNFHVIADNSNGQEDDAGKLYHNFTGNYKAYYSTDGNVWDGPVDGVAYTAEPHKGVDVNITARYVKFVFAANESMRLWVVWMFGTAAANSDQTANRAYTNVASSYAMLKTSADVTANMAEAGAADIQIKRENVSQTALIEAEFAKYYDVERINLGGAFASSIANQFVVSVSIDGETWAHAATKAGITNDEIELVAPVRAKYLRMEAVTSADVTTNAVVAYGLLSANQLSPKDESADNPAVAAVSKATLAINGNSPEDITAYFGGTAQANRSVAAGDNAVILATLTEPTNVDGVSFNLVGGNDLTAAVVALSNDNSNWTNVSESFSGNAIRFAPTQAKYVRITLPDGASATFNGAAISGYPTFPVKPSDKLPAIIRVSEGVGQGNAVSVYGEYFIGTMLVKLEEANVTIAPVQVDPYGQYLRFIYPDTLAPGVYTLRVSNDNGATWSTQSAILNGPDGRWLSDAGTYAGMEMSLYGRNLDARQYGGTTQAALRFVPAGGGAAVNVTSIVNRTPYAITFITPALTPGVTYNIEVQVGSAGLGGEWVKAVSYPTDAAVTAKAIAAPVDVTALAMGVSWTDAFKWNNQINATDAPYNADNTGVTDATAAIQSALDAAATAGGGVVFLSAGRYIISDNLSLGNGVVLKGAGKAQTELHFSTTAVSTRPGYPLEKTLFVSAPGARSIGNHGVASLSYTLDAALDSSVMVMIANFGYGTAKNMFLFDCAFDFNPSGNFRSFNMIGAGPVLVAGNDITTAYCDTWSHNVREYFTIRDNVFSYAAGHISASSEKFSFTGNTVNAIINEVTYYGDNIHGLFTNEGLYGFNMFNSYIGYNEVNNLMYYEGNDCEAFALDSTQWYHASEDIVSWSASSITFAENYVRNVGDWSQDWMILITEGTGLGQLRTIKGHSEAVVNGRKQHTVTVDTPWDVVPDASSKIAIARFHVGNTFEQNVATDINCQVVQFFHGCVDNVASANIGYNTSGSTIYGWVGVIDNGNPAASYFNQIRDTQYLGTDKNAVSYYTGEDLINFTTPGTQQNVTIRNGDLNKGRFGDVWIGERAEDGTYNKSWGPTQYGNEIRNNVVDKTAAYADGQNGDNGNSGALYGIHSLSGLNTGRTLVGSLYEGNVGSNGRTGFTILQGSVVGAFIKDMTYTNIRDEDVIDRGTGTFFMQDGIVGLLHNGWTADASDGTAANAIDGDAGTLWTASGDSIVLTIDLKAARTFNIMQINAALVSEQLEIFTANVNAGWDNLFPITTLNNITAADLAQVAFTPATGRYVRLVFTGAASGISIRDINILPYEMSAVTPAANPAPWAGAATKPNAPVNLAAQSGDGHVTLTWEAPFNGSSVITGYTLTITPAIGDAIVLPAAATSYTVTGLTNNTAYSFRLTAANAIGTSDAAVISVTPRTDAVEPSAPVLSAVAGDGLVMLNWQTGDDGGSAITGFTLTVLQNGTVVGTPVALSASDNTYTAPSLTNGITYSFTLTAANVVGTSAAGQATATPEAPAQPLVYPVLYITSAVTNAPNFNDADNTEKVELDLMQVINGGDFNLRARGKMESSGSNMTDESYIRIDLGSVQPVAKIAFPSGTILYNNGVASGVVSVSEDMNTWTEVGALTANDHNTPDITLSAAVNARYVQIDLSTWDVLWTHGIQICAPVGYEPGTPQPGTLEEVGLTLVSAPAKISYQIGEALDLGGLQVRIRMSDGTTNALAITSGMVSGFSSATAGRVTVTVTYNGFTVTFNVTVQGDGGGAPLTPAPTPTPTPAPTPTPTPIPAPSATPQPLPTPGSDAIVIPSVVQEAGNTKAESETLLVYDTNGGRVGSAAVNSDGSLTIDRLPAGTYLLHGYSSEGHITLGLDDGDEWIVLDFDITPLGAMLPFADVFMHWAKESILQAYTEGWIAGFPDGMLRPDDAITRSQAAALLVRAFELTTPSNSEGKDFADVRNHWAAEAIRIVSALQITSGYSDSRFGPDDVLTREQAITLIMNTLRCFGVTDAAMSGRALFFTDADAIAPWAVDNVRFGVACGIITGRTDNRFDPSGVATRAEIVCMIIRAMDYLVGYDQ